MEAEWYVMRDLKRPNALKRAWEDLAERGFEVFTPLQWRLITARGKRERRLFPVIGDLLFVKASRTQLDPVVASTATLQYRFLKNHYRRPMTVSREAMELFRTAVADSDRVRYYSPDEFTPGMRGKLVRVIGGPLNGYQGRLISVRGSRVKRVIVEIPSLIAAGVEVEPEFIEILRK